MKRFAVLMCALLVSCVAPKPKPRLAVFNESEYAPYAVAGTGVIEGQAFMTQRNGGVVVGAGRVVTLNPVTSYSREWFDRCVVHYESVTPADERSAPFNRTVLADGEGRFRFEGLAPGDYYLACRIVWEAPAGMHLEETGGVAYATVKVQDGKTTRAVVTR